MPLSNAKIHRTIAAYAALVLIGTGVQAGGPTRISNTGAPLLWSTAAPIAYRTDQGPLSDSVSETEARARVLAMFNIWQNVPTASIRYARAGFINATGAFGGGDVNTIAEFNAVEASCNNGTQSPIIYDTTGTIFEDLGIDADVIIGFAGPCANIGTQVVSGRVMLNGRFQDGGSDDLPGAAFDAAMIHEFGHFSGLDHSQISIECLFAPCGDDLDALPTMFPFLIDVAQKSLAPDDIAWISRFYPETAGASTFAGTHGIITGIVYYSDGESHAQLVNVIARQVDAGGNEDRRIAASVVSGYKFRVFHGNPITQPPPSQGSESPGDIGLFEIPVPAGTYTLETESIWREFEGSSSIGPGFEIPAPGSAPPIGPISVAAGATVGGNDIILTSTPPRFDQFETP